MSNLALITYGTTFLVTSGTLKYLNKTIKACLPEIDIELVKDTSPTLASIVSNASVVYDIAAFAATVYTANYAASGAFSAVQGLEALAGMNSAELLPLIPQSLNNLGASNLAQGAEWLVANRGMNLASLSGSVISNVFPIANLNEIPLIFTTSNFGFIGELFTAIQSTVEVASLLTDTLLGGDSMFQVMDITGSGFYL